MKNHKEKNSGKNTNADSFHLLWMSSCRVLWAYTYFHKTFVAILRILNVCNLKNNKIKFKKKNNKKKRNVWINSLECFHRPQHWHTQKHVTNGTITNKAAFCLTSCCSCVLMLGEKSTLGIISVKQNNLVMWLELLQACRWYFPFTPFNPFYATINLFR